MGSRAPARGTLAALLLILWTSATGAAPPATAEFESELRMARDIPVVAISYLAVGSSIPKTEIIRGEQHLRYRGRAQLDCAETKICRERLSAYLANLHNAALRTAEFMTDATRYHGYRDGNAPPALRYKVVDHITVLQVKNDADAKGWAAKRGKMLGYPIEGMIDGYLRGQKRQKGKYRHPTPFLFDELNVCRLVQEKGVRMIYLSSYHSKIAVPAESFSAGPLGNVGNNGGDLGLYCKNGTVLPASKKNDADVTYHVVGFSPTTGKHPSDNTIHNFGHHVEAVFGRADRHLWNQLVGDTGHLDRTKVFTGMPGIKPGQTFEQDNAVNHFGVKIKLLDLRRDRSATLIVTPIRQLPALPRIPGERPPREIPLDERVQVRTDEVVAIRGTDVRFKYWENGGVAKFSVYRPSADAVVVRHCGKTHYPPNAETDYDFKNQQFQVRTDCEDWKPDGSGTVVQGVTCRHWAGARCDGPPSDELAFQKWWQQSFPGLNNRVRWNNKGKTWQMRNWWAFIAEFHQAMGRGKSLAFEVAYQPVAAASELTAEGSRESVRLRWKQAQAGKVAGYNLFRADAAKGPYHRINDVLQTRPEYRDEVGLVGGKTYYYQVRSVGQNGIQAERGPSVAVAIEKGS
jgi:hypothetical protein